MPHRLSLVWPPAGVCRVLPPTTAWTNLECPPFLCLYPLLHNLKPYKSKMAQNIICPQAVSSHPLNTNGAWITCVYSSTISTPTPILYYSTKDFPFLVQLQKPGTIFIICCRSIFISLLSHLGKLSWSFCHFLLFFFHFRGEPRRLWYDLQTPQNNTVP